MSYYAGIDVSWKNHRSAPSLAAAKLSWKGRSRASAVIAAIARFGIDVSYRRFKRGMPAMKELESYFLLTGTGAVTLMGLLFVVITLGAERSE